MGVGTNACKQERWDTRKIHAAMGARGFIIVVVLEVQEEPMFSDRSSRLERKKDRLAQSPEFSVISSFRALSGWQ